MEAHVPNPAAEAPSSKITEPPSRFFKEATQAKDLMEFSDSPPKADNKTFEKFEESAAAEKNSQFSASPTEREIAAISQKDSNLSSSSSDTFHSIGSSQPLASSFRSCNEFSAAVSQDEPTSATQEIKQEPSECLGSTNFHWGLILFSAFVAIMGYVFYTLAQKGKVPDVFQTIGLYTLMLAVGIAIFSALYISVQLISKYYVLLNSGYTMIGDTETVDSMERVMNPASNDRETSTPEIENASVRSRGRASDIQLEGKESQTERDPPSTSAESDNVQKLKTGATSLLETGTDVTSKQSLETSSKKE